jgi:RNA recognition motif-containing protein
MKPGSTEENIKATLMVRGISGLSQEDLETSFSRLGLLKDIRMVKDRFTGDFKDFAFIEFRSESDADQVIEKSQINPIRVSGRPVQVVKSKDRKTDLNNSQPNFQQKEKKTEKESKKEPTCISTEGNESVGEIFLSSSQGQNLKNRNEFQEIWNERLKSGIAICFKCNKWFESVQIGRLHDTCHKIPR